MALATNTTPIQSTRSSGTSYTLKIIRWYTQFITQPHRANKISSATVRPSSVSRPLISSQWRYTYQPSRPTSTTNSAMERNFFQFLGSFIASLLSSFFFLFSFSFSFFLQNLAAERCFWKTCCGARLRGSGGCASCTFPFGLLFYFQQAFSFSCSFSLARLATSLVSVRLR